MKYILFLTLTLVTALSSVAAEDPWSYATLELNTQTKTLTWTTQSGKIENVSAAKLIKQLCLLDKEPNTDFFLGPIGELGWEIVTTTNEQNILKYVFKRRGTLAEPMHAARSGTKSAETKGSTVDSKRTRSQLARKARPALFADNKLEKSNIGAVAVDARWSNYGQYLQKMMESVQLQWEKILANGDTRPASGTVVTVKFIMDSTGSITKVINVEGNKAGQQAESYCVTAILCPSPYGKWSDDMVATLGERQEMSFAFFYK